MVTMPQSPLPPAPGAVTSALDPRKLAIGSLSAVVGGVVGAAFGDSLVMAFAGLALGPWITAFIEHPGPHRRRRVALIALLALLVHGCKQAFASVRARPTSATAGAAARHSARQLARVAATATISAAVAILAITGGELAAGKALAGEHKTTFFGGGRDTRKPTLDLPTGLTRKAKSDAGVVVTYLATASDERDGPLTPSCRPTSGSLFTLGSTPVTCTAIDSAGNVARDAFTVTVVRSGPGADTTPPIVHVPDDIRRPAAGPEGRRIRYDATATDDRDGDLATVCHPPSGSVFALGSRPVSCSARNRAGLATTLRFNVEVFDGPPVLEHTSHVTFAATSDKGARVTFSAHAADAVDGALTPDCKPASGSFFKIGDHEVTCTVSDSTAQTDTGTIAVTVSEQPDTTAPRIIGPRIFSAESVDGAPVAVRIGLRGVDDRDGSVAVSCRPKSGSTFAVGTTSVRCTAHDEAGNEAKPRTVLVRVADTSVG